MTQAPAMPHAMQRLLNASMSIGDVVKDEVNTYYKAKYLTLPKLLNVVRPRLAENGLTLHSCLNIDRATKTVIVQTSIFDVVDGSLVLTSEFPVTDMAMQKVGAACTYGTRQNIMQLLCISAVEDDDGNSAINAQAVPAPPQQQQPQRGPLMPGEHPWPQQQPSSPFL
jgi:hypothetical protein